MLSIGITRFKPSTAHIKYSSVMLALYIYIVLDRKKKQNFGNFFCVGLSDNPIWINGLIAMLCRIGLVKCTNNKKKYLKEYAEYNTFDYKTYNMHKTCENSGVTSNLYKKSLHFALF